MTEGGKSSALSGGAWRTLVLAILLGVAGIVLMVYYLRTKNKHVVLVPVAVAARPITGGDTIKHGMILRRDFPKDVIGGNFVNGNDIVAVEGRIVGVDMDPGQPLYWNAIPLADQGGYDRYLRPEFRERAIALSLGGVLNSAVKAGDVIDILGTYSQGSDLRAFEVLPAVTVIGKVGAVLVLNVTEAEELLLLAAQPCNLTMSIRSKKEPESELKLDPVKLSDVLPKAKELGAERTARLAQEAAATGTIHRD
ncbi:MAG TPA: hypothetical protein VMH22_07565 [bacterium]|nr:hypothetical protein [bacterium]